MKTIEINNTLIVLDQVAAIQLPEMGGSLLLWLAGNNQPMTIPGAKAVEYDRLKKALETP